MVKIDFEVDTELGLYRDALLLPDDHGLTDSELEQIKLDRATAWVDFVKLASQVQPDIGSL